MRCVIVFGDPGLHFALEWLLPWRGDVWVLIIEIARNLVVFSRIKWLRATMGGTSFVRRVRFAFVPCASAIVSAARRRSLKDCMHCAIVFGDPGLHFELEWLLPML